MNLSPLIVSILVLIEFIFNTINITHNWKVANGLNPCFDRIYFQYILTFDEFKPVDSLNPCFDRIYFQYYSGWLEDADVTESQSLF